MAGNVIDQLVVTLGLDDKGFKEGSERAKGGLSNLAGAAQDAGESIGGLVGRIGALALAVVGIGSVTGYVMDLSEMFKELHFSALNLGIDQKVLELWGQTAKLAGGSTSDAAASVNNLQQALFNLRFRGQVSEQLLMLQRLGVQFMSTGGRMRDFNAIAMDTAKALQRTGLDEGMRYQFALSAGFTGGIASAISQGPAQLAALFASATQAAKSQTDKDIDAMTSLAQHLDNLKFAVQAETSHLVGKLTPVLEKFEGALEGIWNWIQKTWIATTGPDSTLAKVTNLFPPGNASAPLTPERITADVWRLFGALDALTPHPSAATTNAYNQVFASALDVPSWMQPAGGGGSVNVDIGTMNINAPNAKDANGIARDMKGAIQRKFATGQADSGVTQ
jgi:hypothetical protein